MIDDIEHAFLHAKIGVAMQRIEAMQSQQELQTNAIRELTALVASLAYRVQQLERVIDAQD